VVSSAPFTSRGRENGTVDVIQPPNNQVKLMLKRNLLTTAFKVYRIGNLTFASSGT